MVNHGNKDGFFNLHPFPDKEGHLSLYRYYKVESSLDRLRPIFLEEKLYHSLPESFNDPFDCRPKTIWPTDAKEMQKIRLHLIKTIRQSGPSRKEAEKTVGELMSKPAAFKSTIEKKY